MSEKVNLAEKLASFDKPWNPKIVGELNGQFVKLAKTDGEFPWHTHAGEDELFLVLDGELEIQLRDRVVPLKKGEFFIVPRGVEHRPVGTASLLLFEPVSTRNTGETENERTLETSDLERI